MPIVVLIHVVVVRKSTYLMVDVEEIGGSPKYKYTPYVCNIHHLCKVVDMEEVAQSTNIHTMCVIFTLYLRW